MGHRWATFRRWANRLDKSAALTDFAPEGIDLAAEPIRSQIVAAVWPRRFALRSSVVVSDDQFVSREEANTTLGNWAPDVQTMAMHGDVQYAFRASDGAEGVTTESLARELEWRRKEGIVKRTRRAVRNALHYV
jgi:hypothetical protein